MSDTPGSNDQPHEVPWGDTPPSEPPPAVPGHGQPTEAAPGFTPPQPGYEQQPDYGQQQPGYGQQQPGYGQQPPYTGVGAGGGVYQAQGGSSSQGSTALALSISGLVVAVVMGFCCGPVGIAGAVLSGIGAYMGHQELAAIDQGRSNPANRGQANAARVIGLIGVGIMVLLFILFIVFFGVSVATSP